VAFVRFSIPVEKSSNFFLSWQKAEPSLSYFLQRFDAPHAFQISLEGKRDTSYKTSGGARVRILPAARFLARLP
jgi:hypothetical protein